MRRMGWIVTLGLAMLLSGCGYNTYQQLDEKSKAAWSEVVNQYQRRADLIPNLQAVVERQANFERNTLTDVIAARAKATSIQVTPETLQDPQALAAYQQAQGQLGGALSRLMAVAEAYPELQANQAFRDLAVSLEGTENRITVARNQYIQTVQEYNVLRRSFPTNLTGMVMGYKEKPVFSVANEAEISVAPRITMPANTSTEGRAAPAQ
ncbi:LemA family protein [Lampropedia puyangensis]|uniref:LemA family protein n=1 Tax=Lampropedia puyangensis TaxID=1330072 RepID=A0A4S8FAA6_9BURK|nr:LemA family protein [Lampropedia puyangensis]THU03755.1 LemA family protein [Lampropedia puyangensis]